MIRKLKVLLVVRWPVGGITSFIRYVYPNFDSKRFEFSVLAPDLPELRSWLEDLQGVNLTYIPIKPNPSIFDYFGAVLRTIIQGRYDLIHSHGFTAGSCGVLPCHLRKTPHLVTLHDVFAEGQLNGVRGFFKKKILSVLLSRVDVVHCVSQDAKDNLLANLKHLKRHNVHAIPNGVAISQFLQGEKRDFCKELNLPRDIFLIGFLGRFMSPKGFLHLIDALDLMIKRDLPKKPLVLTFGYGGFIREEKQNIKNRGLEKYFVHLPFTTNIASAMRGLDVVAMPSIWEACGLVAMEAMVAGVPVIGTNCLGLREVLQNTPACMIPVRDSAALANALVEEMKNPSWSKAAEFAEEAAQRFDVKRQAKGLEKLMLNLTEYR